MGSATATSETFTAAIPVSVCPKRTWRHSKDATFERRMLGPSRIDTIIEMWLPPARALTW
jgi:hypothetical protein